MTKEEFNTLKVGDILTNKVHDDKLDRDMGYDYVVLEKNKQYIRVNVVASEGFTVFKDDIDSCLDLRKK